MIEKIKKKLEENSAAIITSPVSRKHISGFSASDGIIVITSKNCCLFADSRYIEAAKKYSKIKCVIYTGLESVKQFLKEEKIDKAYLESDEITLSEYKTYSKKLGIQLSKSDKISKLLKNARMIKTDREIENIIKAQSITDAAFSHILEFIKIGVTEKEIALELEFFMRKSGSEGVAFDTIAVSGKNSSMPHGVPSKKRIESGDFITMDFGAVVNGYRSDMTRTVAVGNVTAEMERAYETVLRAQISALKEIKAGKKCSYIDKIARDIIDSTEYKGDFGHALGHSVGLDIHEYPNFSPKCNETLKENMVLTVEPGIYLEGKFGVRIEDLIVVKKEGIVNLTKSPKELIIL